MKKLILGLFLLVSGIVKAQTWQADTLVYFSNVYNEAPDTVISELINITISDGYILITKHNARFKAKIVDTLSTERNGVIQNKYYSLLKTIGDTVYSLRLIMSFYDNYLVSMGISHENQLFIYHIQNQLISTFIKPKENGRIGE